MNPEIMKGQLRSLLIAAAGMVVGWFAYRGWISAERAMDILTGPVLGAMATMATGFIWSGLTHRQDNAVAVVDAMAKDPASPVKGVIVEATIAGRDLANSIPGSTVVMAGTHEATTIATR